MIRGVNTKDHSYPQLLSSCMCLYWLGCLLTRAFHIAGFASDSDHSRDSSDTSMVDPEGRSIRQAKPRASSGKRKQAEGSDQPAKRARISGEAVPEGSGSQPADLRNAAAAFLRALDRKSEASKPRAGPDTDAAAAPTVPPAALQEPQMANAAASAPAAEASSLNGADALEEPQIADAAASAPAAEASSLNGADARVVAAPAAEASASLAAAWEGGSTAREASPAPTSMEVDATPVIPGDDASPQQPDALVGGQPRGRRASRGCDGRCTCCGRGT